MEPYNRKSLAPQNPNMNSRFHSDGKLPLVTCCSLSQSHCYFMNLPPIVSLFRFRALSRISGIFGNLSRQCMGLNYSLLRPPRLQMACALTMQNGTSVSSSSSSSTGMTHSLLQPTEQHFWAKGQSLSWRQAFWGTTWRHTVTAVFSGQLPTFWDGAEVHGKTIARDKYFTLKD